MLNCNNGCMGNNSFCLQCDCDPCSCNSNCCNKKEVDIDSCDLKTVCSNMNVIHDTCCAQGTPIVLQLVNAGEPALTVDAMYKSCNGMYGCVVDSNSVFTVESSKVYVRDIQSVDPILASEVLINGRPLINLIDLGTKYTGKISPESTNSLCNNNCLGTNSSVIINGIDNWTIAYDIELCGRVTTSQGICKFRILFSTPTNSPITNQTTVTFICNEVCVPDTSEETNIIFKIDSCGQIINPVISVTPQGDSVSLSATLLITPQAPIQITQDKVVCFKGTI